MGQAGVALADDPGGYYNPAAPALQTRSHAFATVNYKGKMPWLPELADDLGYSYNAIQAGWNSRMWSDRSRSLGDSPRPEGLFSIGGALSYYRTELDLGTQTRTGERGEFIGTFSSFDRAHNYTFSASAHYLIDVGFGYTIKKITSSLADQGAGIEQGRGRAKATARDYGFLARAPLVDIAEYALDRRLVIQNHLRPHLELTRGVTWNNRGDDVAYIDASQADPLPAHRRFGWAGSAGLSWIHETTLVDLVSLTRSVERYEPEIEGTGEPHTFDDKEGWELSFFDTYQIRRGTYDDDDGEIHLDTEGYTVKSDGVFRLLALYRAKLSPSSANGSQGDALSFLLEHLSMSWSRFKYDDTDSPLGGTDHVQVSVVF